MENQQNQKALPHSECIDLNLMKGGMVKTTVCSYRVSGDEPFYKELTATIIFSAKDYKPHVILSVKNNGVTQHFGTNTKKAIDYYNSI